MNRELHRARHVQLHQALDELVTDYFRHHPNAQPETVMVATLLTWASQQTAIPADPPLLDSAHHNGAVDGDAT